MRHWIETNNRMLNDDLTPISGWSSGSSVTMRQRTRTSGLWSSTHSGSLLLLIYYALNYTLLNISTLANPWKI